MCFNFFLSLVLRFCSEDKKVRVWNYRSTVCTLTLDGHSAGITALAVFPSGRYVATAARDGSVRIWDLHNRKEKCVLRNAHNTGSDVTSVCVLSEWRVVSGGGSLDRQLCVWDIDSPFTPMCKHSDAYSEFAGVSALVTLPASNAYDADTNQLPSTSASEDSSTSSAAASAFIAAARNSDLFASCCVWSNTVKVWQYQAHKRQLKCITTIV